MSYVCLCFCLRSLSPLIVLRGEIARSMGNFQEIQTQTFLVCGFFVCELCHAHLLCSVPILTDDPRRESNGFFACELAVRSFTATCSVFCLNVTWMSAGFVCGGTLIVTEACIHDLSLSIYIYICIFTHTYTYTYTHIHTYTCMCIHITSHHIILWYDTATRTVTLVL